MMLAIRLRGSERSEHGRILFAVVVFSLLPLTRAVVTCPAFPNAQNSFDCPEESVQELAFTHQSRWYQLGNEGNESRRSYGIPWIEKSASCCRHCVWELGYPAADPLATATDRTNTRLALHLDCTQFGKDFDSLDVDASGALNQEEFQEYLQTGANK
eukprot:2543600-Rhodomonas_salina.2